MPLFKPQDEKTVNEQNKETELNNIKSAIKNLRKQFNTVFDPYWKNFLPCSGGEAYPNRNKNLTEKLAILAQIRSQLEPLKIEQEKIFDSVINQIRRTTNSEEQLKFEKEGNQLFGIFDYGDKVQEIEKEQERINLLISQPDLSEDEIEERLAQSKDKELLKTPKAEEFLELIKSLKRSQLRPR